MPAFCPSCGTFLLQSALRCQRCGVATRWGPHEPGDTLDLASVLSLEQARILRQVDELEQLAPEVLLWMRAHPRERARLLELLSVLYGPGAKR